MDPQPTDDEAARLLEIHQRLTDLGVASRDGAYDLSLLAAAVYARGWSYRIDRAGGDFQATIVRSGDNQRQFQASASGWSMDAALAGALANALSAKAAR
jgi:hypothetical protein